MNEIEKLEAAIKWCALDIEQWIKDLEDENSPTKNTHIPKWRNEVLEAARAHLHYKREIEPLIFDEDIPELNISNFDLQDVERINNGMIEIHLAAAKLKESAI